MQPTPVVLKKIIKASLEKIKGQKVIANFLNLSIIQVSNVLLLTILYPIITLKIGIEEFGIFIFANTFSNFAAAFINYGTNQSGIRDIAENIKNKPKQSKVLNEILAIRFLIFVAYLIILLILYFTGLKYFDYILWALPLVIAEVLNPLFFFTGIEKLKAYNQANLVSKILSLALIILLIKSKQDTVLVNLILGSSSCLIFIYLLFTIFKENFTFQMPAISEVKKIAVDNFHLTINNASVQLQQSIMIFVLARLHAPLVLGAYSLCDKVIWSVRMLIISISMAIYPKSVQVFAEGQSAWLAYKSRFRQLITISFMCMSIGLFIFSDFVIYILSGTHNVMASNFLKMMAFVPTIAALNSLNIIELLIKKENTTLSKTAIFLAIFSFATAWILTSYSTTKWFGIYTFSVEITALLIYEYLIKKSEKRWVNQ